MIINKCDRNLLISPSARPSAGSDCTPWARRRLRISQRFVPRALLVLRGSEAQAKFHSIYVAVRQFPPPAGLVPTYSKGPDKTAMSSLVTERNMVLGSGVRMDGRTVVARSGSSHLSATITCIGYTVGLAGHGGWAGRTCLQKCKKSFSFPGRRKPLPRAVVTVGSVSYRRVWYKWKNFDSSFGRTVVGRSMPFSAFILSHR